MNTTYMENSNEWIETKTSKNKKKQQNSLNQIPVEKPLTKNLIEEQNNNSPVDNNQPLDDNDDYERWFQNMINIKNTNDAEYFSFIFSLRIHREHAIYFSNMRKLKLRKDAQTKTEVELQTETVVESQIETAVEPKSEIVDESQIKAVDELEIKTVVKPKSYLAVVGSNPVVVESKPISQKKVSTSSESDFKILNSKDEQYYIQKNEALLEAQEEFFNECIPTQEKIKEVKILLELNNKKALRCNSISLKNDDIKVRGDKFKFSKRHFLQNAFFVNKITREYVNIFSDKYWVKLVQNLKNDGELIVMLDINYKKDSVIEN